MLVPFYDHDVVTHDAVATDLTPQQHLELQFKASSSSDLIDDAEIRIGARVMLGPRVTIATAGHPLDPALRSTAAQFSAVVTIEDEVWVGANATVLPGVTIGRGSVVAAGAVVTRSVPPMRVVGGVPARVVRVIEPGEQTAYREPGTLEP